MPSRLKGEKPCLHQNLSEDLLVSSFWLHEKCWGKFVSMATISAAQGLKPLEAVS